MHQRSQHMLPASFSTFSFLSLLRDRVNNRARKTPSIACGTRSVMGLRHTPHAPSQPVVVACSGAVPSPCQLPPIPGQGPCDL